MLNTSNQYNTGIETGKLPVEKLRETIESIKCFKCGKELYVESQWHDFGRLEIKVNTDCHCRNEGE